MTLYVTLEARPSFVVGVATASYVALLPLCCPCLPSCLPATGLHTVLVRGTSDGVAPADGEQHTVARLSVLQFEEQFGLVYVVFMLQMCRQRQTVSNVELLELSSFCRL